MNRRLPTLLLLQALSCTAAHAAASDATIAIDDTQFPIITISANHAPLADVLTQLSSRLGFEIDRLPSESQQTVTATLRGELGDLLRSDALGGLNFLLMGRGPHVRRLIFFEPEPLGGALANAAQPVGRPRSDAMSAVPQLPAGGMPQSLASPKASAADRVGRLLLAQAMEGSAQAVSPTNRMSVPNQVAQPTSAATGAVGSPSMAATLRTAMVNASALSAALRSVCIGPSCGR